MSIGLLILRLAVGLSLAAHGAQKLFGWFGGYGIAGTGQFLEQLGFRPGRLYAAQAGIAEVAGGLFLAAGILTPAAAATVVAVMLVAAVSAHIKNGFFAHNGGYEYTLVLGAVALGEATERKNAEGIRIAAIAAPVRASHFQKGERAGSSTYRSMTSDRTR